MPKNATEQFYTCIQVPEYCTAILYTQYRYLGTCTRLPTTFTPVLHDLRLYTNPTLKWAIVYTRYLVCTKNWYQVSTWK